MEGFLGTRIQDTRQKKNLKSKDTAKLIGVSPSTWSLYENNKRIPPVETLKILAQKLEVSMDHLAGLKSKLK